MSVNKKAHYAGLTRDEKIEELADTYKEGIEEFGALLEGLELMVKGLRTVKMPEERIWATIVVSSAEALGLDLDTEGGIAAAAVLATYQVRGI